MPVVIGGDNLPSPVRIGLTDLQNIGGASGPPGPPGSGTTVLNTQYLSYSTIFYLVKMESGFKINILGEKMIGTHFLFLQKRGDFGFYCDQVNCICME